MIPDFQSLMLPVLKKAAEGEVAISQVVRDLAEELNLSEDEKNERLPSGQQTRFANRANWAKSYLNQAGLIKNTGRGLFRITDEGLHILSENPEKITKETLERFPAYQEFLERRRGSTGTSRVVHTEQGNRVAREGEETPEEQIKNAHDQIRQAVSLDLLERLQESDPAFFESVIVRLLLKMGYGTDEDAGHVLGKSGDDGVDGVIHMDPLGVDSVFVQAKRYKSDNVVGSGAIRDFFGALSMKDVSRGIFVTTSSFSKSARETSDKLAARIVLIDGERLADLCVQYEIGCAVRQTFSIVGIDESFFE